MRIIINNSSMQPIYEQMVSQIKNQILKDELKAETPLPSVRGLAKELKISALTVKKAYDTLEEEGFIVTIHGKGSYVSGKNESLREEENRKQVEEQLETAINHGIACGMEKAEIRELFDLIMEDI